MLICRYTTSQWTSPTPVGCNANFVNNYGIHIQDYYNGTLLFCYDTTTNLIPHFYSCDNCIDTVGFPQGTMQSYCFISPIITCFMIPVNGKFRIGLYSESGERSDVIYRKGSCPRDGNIEQICNVPGALTGENIV